MVQMAKVKTYDYLHTHKKNLSAYNLTLSSVFFHSQLVCEEVNVDRFYPVLYPKVSNTPHCHFIF